LHFWKILFGFLPLNSSQIFFENAAFVSLKNFSFLLNVNLFWRCIWKKLSFSV